MTGTKLGYSGSVIAGRDRCTWGLLAVGTLVAFEICLLLATYSFGFDCIDFIPQRLCYGLSLVEIRAVTFIGAVLLLALAHPSLRAVLFSNENGSQRRQWLTLQLVGFSVLMIPWALAAAGWSNPILSTLCWLSGGLLAAAGTAFAVNSPARWRKALFEVGPSGALVLALGAFAPELARLSQQIWHFQPLTKATFNAVVKLLELFGVQVASDSATYTLSSEAFGISVAPICSGFEGMGLTVAFLGAYFLAFRESLRFPNVWLLVPIGIALSWLLNVVRIASLFELGNRGHSELAIDGFHSHAGWLMFSLLAFALIGVSRTVPWFQKADTHASHVSPLSQDWTAARIVPFAALMAASLVLSTFTLVPQLWYGVKVLAMACALMPFLPLYRARVTWQLDPLSAFIGIAVGVVWIAFGNASNLDGAPFETQLAGLSATLWVTWIILRLAGTIVLVPLVEELFFRGYVLDRFSQDGLAWRVFGLLLSTALFAVLHDRWILAALAGALYGALYLRRRCLTDAITAHAMSNAVIGFYALATSQWSLI